MYRAANLLSPEDMYAVARMAYLEMLMAGITTVGEFHYVHHAADGTPYADPNLIAREVIRAANNVGIRIVLLRTAYERAGYRKSANTLQHRFLFRDVETFLEETETLLATATAPVGIALHSVRALEQRSIVAIVEYARKRQVPIHMHVAEQPVEIEECLAEYGCRPVEFLQQHGILSSDFTAVHAIYITEAEAQYLGTAHSMVCACPTTERNLGDGPVPADLLLEKGADICFGSDSNAQIDLLEDARCLEYHLRMSKLQRAILPVKALYGSATAVGARSLGVVADPGDYFTVDLTDPSLAGSECGDLTTQVLFSAHRGAIRDVFVGGKQVIAGGMHSAQDEIVTAFEEVQRHLWE
jgi:formimidoylglutamate deiminase